MSQLHRWCYCLCISILSTQFATTTTATTIQKKSQMHKTNTHEHMLHKTQTDTHLHTHIHRHRKFDTQNEVEHFFKTIFKQFIIIFLLHLSFRRNKQIISEGWMCRFFVVNFCRKRLTYVCVHCSPPSSSPSFSNEARSLAHFNLSLKWIFPNVQI